MTGPPGLQGAKQRLAWLRRAYYGLDGRWYLKVRDRLGPAGAQEADEEVCESLGRLHLRAWRELCQVGEISDCHTFGQFVRDVFQSLHDDAGATMTVVRDEPATFEFRQDRCTIFEMAVAAGYESDPQPGKLPGCAGVLALYRGWTAAAGDYAVDQQPAPGGAHGVRCRYVFRQVGDR